MPPSSQSAMSACSSRQDGSMGQGASRGKPAGIGVLYTLKERVCVEAGERMLRSPGMQRLQMESEPYWQSICNAIYIAKATGGHIPVDYTRPPECPDYYGRMKVAAATDGVPCTPYVRMLRQARAVLAAPYYVDVDMVNCQPCIFAQKLKLHDIACPLLDRYVADRGACLEDVKRACGVGPEAAKNLFIRLMYLGGVSAWARDHGVDPSTVPGWVDALKAELRSNAEHLIALPDLEEFRAVCGRRAGEDDTTEASEDAASVASPLATMLAVYLQSAECECVRALVDAVRADGFVVGAIICDGVLVEKADALTSESGSRLRRWSAAIMRKTGLTVDLAVKRMNDEDPQWTDVDASASADDDAWLKGHVLLRYEDMKPLWERSAFKIVKSGNYVREELEARDIFSDKMLHDSYKHLHYAVFKQGARGDARASVSVSMMPFIARWTKDPRIRSFKDMVLMPPPMVVPPDTYNIWNGFAVERYVPAAPVDVDSEAVRAFVSFFDTLLGHKTDEVKYVLDWFAQIFQQPSVKTGIAILFCGCEGAGKNRATDLFRLMVGSKDRFLQTASPSNTLFGRFNRVREGKLLIVINESSGSDNFAANDLIKDMITCDEFVSEGKGTNSYAIACFARFIFTTNNDNALKITPDSRRYYVKEVSSALKGNHEYFRVLSAHIDDPHGRYEFYKFLMARDLRGIDWINHRPITDYQLSMIDINMPPEHQFIKAFISEHFHSRTHSHSRARPRPPGDPLVKTVKMDALFADFLTWATLAMGFGASRLENMNSKKFGLKISKLVWTADCNTIGFHGLTKTRCGSGIVYTFDVPLMAREMLEKRWAVPDEFPFGAVEAHPPL